MAVPTIASITPDEGLTLAGNTFVKIIGTNFNLVAQGTVKVFFGTLEALEVQVVFATEIHCLSPGGQPGEVVDVKVENVNITGPNEEVTEVGAFTHRRPDLSTNPTFDTHSEVAIITRAIIIDLRRTVIENAHHDLHPEYVDAQGAVDAQEVQASAPNLKILGPTVVEDRFRSFNGRVDQETDPGEFEIRDEPVTWTLTYQYVGVGRTPSEATNILRALTAWIKTTIILEVPADGLNPANGVRRFELNPNWEDRATFRSQATRAAIYQFSGSFRIDGVHILGQKVGEGREVTELLDGQPNLKLTVGPL